MAQRLTRLQVNHLRSKINEKVQAKMAEWDAENPKPKDIEDALCEEMQMKTLAQLAEILKRKSTGAMIDGIAVETNCDYHGNNYVRVTFKCVKDTAKEMRREKRIAYCEKVDKEAEKIIDVAVFTGAEEALAMLEAF